MALFGFRSIICLFALMLLMILLKKNYNVYMFGLEQYIMNVMYLILKFVTDNVELFVQEFIMLVYLILKNLRFSGKVSVIS